MRRESNHSELIGRYERVNIDIVRIGTKLTRPIPPERKEALKQIQRVLIEATQRLAQKIQQSTFS